MIARKLSACMLVVLLTASAFAFVSFGARAEQGAQDAYGYYWIDSNSPSPTVTYSWVDITATGTYTGLSADDSWGGPYPIGFPFEFYGNTYEMFNLSTNGFMQFAGSSSDLGNDPIPSTSTPNNIISPCWDDLVTTSGGVYYQTFGTSPDQTLVVEYYNVYRYGSYYYLTFEIILHENGEIWFQYEYLDGWSGQWATVGIEDSTGANGCEYSFNEYALSEGLAIMFAMGPIGLTPYSEQTASWDATAMHELIIRNAQSFTDSFDLTFFSLSAGWTVTLTDGSMVPLVDNNGNLIPDTGDMLAGETVTVYVLVDVPADPTSLNETTILTAASYTNPSITASSTVLTLTFSAQLGTAHSDYLEDTDLDGDADYLCVDVDVYAVAGSGVYLEGALQDGSSTTISYVSYSFYVPVGSSYATISFPGDVIFAYGVDGPFYVDIYMFDENYIQIDSEYDYETGAYAYTGFDPPPAVFEPPHSDSAIDDGDSNTQYDFLVVSASVMVYDAGTYIVQAQMYDTAYDWYIQGVTTTEALDAGLQTVDIMFPALAINQSGLDGPYRIYMDLYTDSYSWLDYDEHVTGTAYLYDDFEGVRAEFVTPFGETTYDADSDTLYDSLNVTAYMTCYESGLYDLEVWVYDPAWNTLTQYTVTLSLTDGATAGYTIVLESEDIYVRMLSGYYYFYLYLYDNTTGTQHDSESYQTSYYDYSLFDPFDATIGSITDMGRDTDSDALYNEIVVTVAIQPLATGDFTLVAYVYDSYWNSFPMVVEVVSLEESVSYDWEIVISGEDFASHGVDGWLYLELYILDESEGYYLDYTSYYTQDYYIVDFDQIGAFFGAITEGPVDTDSDGSYNEIVVNITVEPATTGDYVLVAYVYDYYYYWDMYVAEEVYLEEGVDYYWEIVIPGDDIYLEWLYGPFELYLYTYDETWSFNYDYEYFTTAYYYPGDFDYVGAYFYSVSDEGVDTDSDGYYNELVITATVAPESTGYFMLYAEVYDYYYNWFTDVQELVYLEEGVLYEWDIVVTGDEFISNGVSGYLLAYLDIYDEDMYYWFDGETYYTSYYYLDDFDPVGAFFLEPYDEYLQDDDSDGFYDSANTVVYVEAASAGYYDVGVWIYDPSWSTYTGMMFYLYLEADEVGEVLIEIPSTAISSLGYDGSWYLEMYIYGHYSGANFDYDGYYTDYYYVSQFEPTPVQFDPPHTDYMLDTDSDSYYDYLVVEVQLDCYAAGTYTVYAELYDYYYGYYIASMEISQYMVYGNSMVEFDFEGWLIYYTGSYGYFEVYLEVMDSEGVVLDEDWHYTSDYYNYYYFEPPPAYLYPPYSDFSVDDDSDSLYEYLVVNVSVEAYVPGDYIVYGVLGDGYGYDIDEAMSQVHLEAGVNSTLLWFDAWPIFIAAWDPYYVDLYLYDTDWNEMDYDLYYLDNCSRSEFDSTPPTIEAGWAYVAPTVDGIVGADEWFGAAVVDIAAVDWLNAVEATMKVMNDGEVLYILVDATGDLTESDADASAVAFDTGNDGYETDMGEDQFIIEATAGSLTYTTHLVFDDWYWEWESDCAPFDALLPDHEGLAGAAGFGASPALSESHRIYEFSIPLALLGVAPGDDIGFAGLSEYSPLVVDAEEDYVYSTWPMYVYDPIPLFAYGDLILSEERPFTAVDLSGTGGEAGWFVSDVEVNLTATGGTGGVANTSYNIDGAGWQTYDTPFTIDTDGVHTLEYYSIDMAGNEEPVRSVSVMIDTVAPDTTGAAVEGTAGLEGWLVSEATVTFTVVDATSGLSAFMYRVDGGDWTALTGFVLAVLEDGDHTVEYYAVDVAGNEEAVVSVSVKVDTGAPVTVVTVDGSSVTFDTVDGDGSGVSATMYRIDGGEWVLYEGEFVVEGSGTYTVEYYSVDVAGNNETVKSVSVEGKAGILGLDIWVWLVVIAAAVAVLILVFFLVKRKPKQPVQMVPGQAVVEPQVQETPPPPPA